jgi:flotillin
MANLQRAASQFVSKTREQIIDMVRETLEGHQRAIMAELTVDEIYKDRLMFQRKVRETADVDLAKMGLRVISYTLKDVSDANGYMASLGVRRIEEVKKEARMGEAQEASEADQRCHLYSAQVTQKQKECEIEVASSLKNFTMRQQEWKNEVIEAQQEAAMQTALEIEVQNKKIAELKGAVDATRVKWQTELEKLEKERKELQLKADENLRAEILREESNIIAEAKTKAAILVRTDRS